VRLPHRRGRERGADGRAEHHREELPGCDGPPRFSPSARRTSPRADARRTSPPQRATAFGLVISGFGLSAFLFSALAHALFPGDTAAFLALLALGTSLPALAGLFLVRPVLPPNPAHPELGRYGPLLQALEHEREHDHDHDHAHAGHAHHGFAAGRGESAEALLTPRSTGVNPFVGEHEHVHRVSSDEEHAAFAGAVAGSRRERAVELSPPRARRGGSGSRVPLLRGHGRSASVVSVGTVGTVKSLEDVSVRALLRMGDFWLLFAAMSLSEFFV
jgi:hypothetical protein